MEMMQSQMAMNSTSTTQEKGCYSIAVSIPLMNERIASTISFSLRLSFFMHRIVHSHTISRRIPLAASSSRTISSRLMFVSNFFC